MLSSPSKNCLADSDRGAGAAGLGGAAGVGGPVFGVEGGTANGLGDRAEPEALGGVEKSAIFAYKGICRGGMSKLL